MALKVSFSSEKNLLRYTTDTTFLTYESSKKVGYTYTNYFVKYLELLQVEVLKI